MSVIHYNTRSYSDFRLVYQIGDLEWPWKAQWRRTCTISAAAELLVWTSNVDDRRAFFMLPSRFPLTPQQRTDRWKRPDDSKSCRLITGPITVTHK